MEKNQIKVIESNYNEVFFSHNFSCLDREALNILKK
jgi:hypothetical protein